VPNLGDKMIYEDDVIYIEREISPNPWVKVFTKREFKELSDCDSATFAHLMDACMICERTMRQFYAPDKINWASFANYVPRVHVHIIARFADDEYFPESMWGARQRDWAGLGDDKCDSDEKFAKFCELLCEKLNAKFSK